MIFGIRPKPVRHVINYAVTYIPACYTATDGVHDARPLDARHKRQIPLVDPRADEGVPSVDADRPNRDPYLPNCRLRYGNIEIFQHVRPAVPAHQDRFQ